MSRKNSKRAFTLVELMMVILIIGMLLALLIPAVNSARENARNNTCKNNLRQVAVAIDHYESKRGKYPGVVDGIVRGNNLREFIARPLIYMILPQLERKDLYEVNDGRNYPQDGVDLSNQLHLAVLVCPSDPKPSGASATSYVYNTGMPGPLSPSTPGADNPANGVFTFRYINYLTPPAGGISASYITSKDGTTNTLMLTENMDAGNWHDMSEVTNGWVWHDIAVATPPYSINGLKGQRGGDTDLKWARPSSNHVHSVNVAFCDGHVRGLRNDVEYWVLAQLMTSSGQLSGYGQKPTVGPPDGGPQFLKPSPRDSTLDEFQYN
jgi:prepilin-type N-terminal cleavage/methylation domain-containing protein/prepilin-type processing-associated H-X9-DG protein